MKKLAFVLTFTGLVGTALLARQSVSSAQPAVADADVAEPQRSVGVIDVEDDDDDQVSRGIVVQENLAGEEFGYTDKAGTRYLFKVLDDGETVTLEDGKTNGCSTLVIPDKVPNGGQYFPVVQIENFAFCYNRFKNTSPMAGVTRLVIPEGVVSVGQNCFEGAPDLEIVQLPASLNNLGYMMFADCPKLTTVNIPAKSQLITIATFAFTGCTSLQNFVIPESVVEVGEGPWRGCTSLQKFDGLGNRVLSIKDGVLYNRWRNQLVQYPAGKPDKSYKIESGTKEIGNSAFWGNPYIETVTIPATVDSISHIAFYDCKSLRKVDFKGPVSFIGNKAFRECPALKKITLRGNPKYTNDPDDDFYNTFDAGTEVVVKP